MKRLTSILLFLLPLLATSQVNEYSAKRIRATDSLYVNGRWIRKITTDLNTTDSNSHNMLPTNRAVMDMIRTGGGEATGNAGGDLSGTYPNPRLARTVTGTGNMTQLQNNIVIGDTISRLGLIFSDNFARASLGSSYGNVGTQTFSFPSSAYLQINGTFDYNNNIFRTDYTAVNRFIDSVRFTTGVPGAATYGLMFSIYDPVNFTTGVRIQFGTATGGVTNIYFRYYDGTQLAASASPQTINAGDSLLAIVRREDNVFTCTYRNLTTGAAATVLTYTFNTASTGTSAPASGRVALGSLGGTQNVSSWIHRSDEVKYQLAVVGNSIAAGGYTATIMENSWPNLVFPSRDTWARLGGSGDRASDAVSYIPQVLAMDFRHVLYCLGVNDALNSVTGASYSSSVTTFVDSCLAHGIGISLVELPPNNSVLTKPYSDTLAAIAARKGITYITGIYDGLRTGTAYNATYSTDGTHLNDAGHRFTAGVIAPQLTSVNYSLKLLNIPSDSTGSERLLVRSDNGDTKTNIKANTVQRIGNPVRVGDQLLLPNAATPGLSITAASANAFNNIIQNPNVTGWAGFQLNNSSGLLRAGYGWANSGTSAPMEADQAVVHKTFGVLGKYSWYPGNNSVTANPPTLHLRDGNVQIAVPLANSSDANIASRRLFVNGSVGIRRDSLSTITDATNQYLVTIDASATGDSNRLKKFLMTNLLPLGQANQTLTGNRTVSGTEVYDLRFTGIDTFEVTGFHTGINGRFAIENELNESIIESSGAVTFTTSVNYVFTGTTQTWTLPALASSAKRVYHVKNAGSGNLTIDTAGGNIYDTASQTSIVIPAGGVRTFKAGSSFWYVFTN
jgi:hypothetical protein